MNTHECPGATQCCNPGWCKTASKCLHQQSGQATADATLYHQLWQEAEAENAKLRGALLVLADTADEVGVIHFDGDNLPPSVDRMKEATLCARSVAQGGGAGAAVQDNGPDGRVLTEGVGLPVLAFDAGGDVRIEAARQRDGSTLWAVRRGSGCLSNDGQWEYEPLNSSRDDEFFARCRYKTPHLALDAFQAARKHAS